MKINTSLKMLFALSTLTLLSLIAYQFVYLPFENKKNVGGCIPLNFKKEKKDNEYYLFWETKDLCTGYVKYGLDQNSFPYLGLDQQGVVAVKNHQLKLSGIEKGSKFYFVIISNDKTYGIGNLPVEMNFD
jgi:hypothetical protein